MANEGGRHFKPKGAPMANAGAPRVDVQAPSHVRPVSPSPYARPARSAQGRSAGPRGANPAPGRQSRDGGKRRGNILSNLLIIVGVALLLLSAGLFVKAQIGYKQAEEYYDGVSKAAIKDSSGESNLLIIVGVALLLLSAGLFVKAQIGYKQAEEYYDGVSKAAIKDSSGDDGIPTVDFDALKKINEDVVGWIYIPDTKVNYVVAQGETNDTYLRHLLDGIPTVDFDALKKINEDVVGWIYIPDTKVNYVVAQGETNDTYLRHLLSGEYNVGGTIFMDMDDVAPGMVDQQTTIYGHHMNDGSMFKVIDDSRNQDAFDAIGKVYYITPEATYVLKPMFTMLVQDDYVDARKANFDGEKAFTQYLQASLAKAEARAKDAADEVEKADKVLTLVTCAGDIIPRTTRAGMVCRVVDTIPAE